MKLHSLAKTETESWRRTVRSVGCQRTRNDSTHVTDVLTADTHGPILIDIRLILKAVSTQLYNINDEIDDENK